MLGPFEVRIGGSPPVPLGGMRQRALLALLTLHAGEVVSTDRLIDQLWGAKPPPTALHTVQVFVSRLRGVLGPAADCLVTRGPGYVLEVDADGIDAARCERLYTSGRAAIATGDHSRAEDLLREALALWRGVPLAEFTYEAFAQAAIARLEELRLSIREELIEAELALGRHEQLVPELESFVREQPLRERPRGQLMLALYRCGRQAEALEDFRLARQTLIDELGVEPGLALRELNEAILRQDPTLQLPRPSPESHGSESTQPVDWSGEQASRVTDENRDMEFPAEAEPSRPIRKVVTVLFCEVCDPTELAELDPEVLTEVMARVSAAMLASISAHGGTIQNRTQDGVSAVFGVPQLHEDDAARAVRSAADIHARVRALGQEHGGPVRCRSGISTGLTLVGAGGSPVTGQAVSVAAGIGAAAAAGEILLSSETLDLVRDAVQVEPLPHVMLRGGSRPVAVFRLVKVDPFAPGIARRLDIPIVDRRRELRLMRDAWDRVVDEAGCHLFTVLGAAGVGKSRLVSELLGTVADAAWVLQGRCLHYGEGITFWPLIEAFSPIGEAVQPILELLTRGGAATREELFWDFRRLFESLAADRPVILHVDDLQWAEPMLLDLLEHVVDLSRGAPIEVLCTARPELFDDRPTWAGGKLNATTLLLEPLSTSDSEALLDLLGNGLGSDVRERIVDASEGNPLFLEEMAALARERQGTAVPATIHALIAARLERLRPEERDLLERAAIEGQVFHQRVVRALGVEAPIAELRATLTTLTRKELIRPHPPTIAGDDAFAFRHMLIRDAAYDALPKNDRADLHERLAHWLEEKLDDLAEKDQLLAWHLEQAIRYREELGRPVDPRLAVCAAEHLHAAGRKARERNDSEAARKLLERGLALAPEQESLSVQIGLDLAEQLIEAGELTRADELLSRAEHDPDYADAAVVSRFEWLIRVRPHDAVKEIADKLPGALRRLARVGDEGGIARAHLAMRMMHVLESKATPAAEQARLAAEHAGRAGDEGLQSRALAMYLTSIMYGRQSAQAIQRELDRIENVKPGSYLAARIDLTRGELARLEGEFESARRLMTRAIDGFHTLAMPWYAAQCEQDLGRMELSAGDPRAALASLRRSEAILSQLGERLRRSTTQAHIAQAHELLGERDAALAAIDIAEGLGAPEDVLNYVITHQVRARLVLADGDGEGALRWARSAVEHASQTDYIVFQAGARLELARVEFALGRADSAASTAAEALELFSLKGDQPGAKQSQALLDHYAELCHETSTPG
jgi:DNA-binding SARP family transcriptional activator/class 3 adenylate cyclase